jgi:hypothetical protein
VCWGQGNSIANYNSVYYLHMYDRRLPYHDNQSCVDCNRYDRRDQLCTFEADYFTATVGHALTCPFQTESRQ